MICTYINSVDSSLLVNGHNRNGIGVAAMFAVVGTV